jgi:hypothetical protein
MQHWVWVQQSVVEALHQAQTHLALGQLLLGVALSTLTQGTQREWHGGEALVNLPTTSHHTEDSNMGNKTRLVSCPEGIARSVEVHQLCQTLLLAASKLDLKLFTALDSWQHPD